MTEMYMTLEQIVATTEWSVHQVRRIAKRDDWGRLGCRPQRYRVSDVMVSLEQSPRMTRVRRHLLRKYGRRC